MRNPCGLQASLAVNPTRHVDGVLTAHPRCLTMTYPRLRALARPIPLALLLGFFTAIPVINGGVLSLQVLFNAVPADSLRLMVAPTALFLHALAGTTFGVTGPLQFTRALRGRYDRLHRVSGRAFVVSGLWLGLSGLMLLVRVESVATAVLDAARGCAGAALLVALAQGMRAIRAHDFVGHRAWMIRAYAIGKGSGTVALVFFPIYLVAGVPWAGPGRRPRHHHLVGPQPRSGRNRHSPEGVTHLIVPRWAASASPRRCSASKSRAC
ncbi:MAG: DUF2306 domain-containing protein [Burkholderiaceae bacterium]